MLWCPDIEQYSRHFVHQPAVLSQAILYLLPCQKLVAQVARQGDRHTDKEAGGSKSDNTRESERVGEVGLLLTDRRLAVDEEIFEYRSTKAKEEASDCCVCVCCARERHAKIWRDNAHM